jgi:hypothetical protein
MLSIIRYIKANGLAKAIETFKLKTRVYENKILLKYDQIESNMSFEEVQDCRGLILERDTWKIMSMSFRKFFNHGEGNAASIDWNTARVLEKVDGTMIQVYWDWHKNTWFAGTTGMAEAEGEVNNIEKTTFSTLFWNTANLDKTKLDKDLNYVFELCTPENIVVTPHTEYKAILLAVRNRVTLQEMSYLELGLISEALSIPLVKSFDMKFSSFDDIKKTFEGMPFSEEGYVVIDGNFNRVKIKNPAYVAAHMLKGKSGFHHIMDIIKTNEVEEYIATFPNRRDEIINLKVSYDNLLNRLTDMWVVLANETPKNGGKTQKSYAELVFKYTNENNLKCFSGLFFGLANDKISSIGEYLLGFDNKTLYELLR